MENRAPEVYRKSSIIGGIGGLIGAAVGGYVSALKGNYIYAGLGAGIGIILGQLVGIVAVRGVALHSLVKVENKINLVIASLGFMMMSAGLIAYFYTGEPIGIIGAIFFALCGIYLVMKDNRDAP